MLRHSAVNCFVRVLTTLALLTQSRFCGAKSGLSHTHYLRSAGGELTAMEPLELWIPVSVFSGLLLVCYGVLACQWDTHQTVALGRWGSWWNDNNGRVIPERTKNRIGWTLLTLVTVVSYLVLLVAASAKPTTRDVVIFSAFPCVAIMWPIGVIGHTKNVPADVRRQHANAAVIATAAASMFLLLTVDGRRSSVLPGFQWACAAWVVGHHLVIDGIWWPAAPAAPNDSWRALHSIAACIHYTAAFVLFAWGTIKAEYDGYQYLFPVRYNLDSKAPTWEYKCTDFTFTCDENNRVYMLSNRTHRYPLLHLAAFYAIWSGTVHLAAAIDLWDLPRRQYKWIDYFVSAPLMLSVVGVTFGNFSLSGVLIGPLHLLVALIIAAIVEKDPAATRNRREEMDSNLVDALRSSPNASLALAWLLFAASWVPTVMSIADARKQKPRAPTETSPGRGQMPVIVVYYFCAIVLLFASFGLVYMWYQYRPALLSSSIGGCANWVSKFFGAGTLTDGGATCREKAYLALSMVTKLTLHTFLLLTVIALGLTLDGSESDTMQQLGYGYGASFFFIVGAGFIVKFTGPVRASRDPASNDFELDYATNFVNSEMSKS